MKTSSPRPGAAPWRAAVLLTLSVLLAAPPGLAGIAVSDYSATATDCGGTTVSTVSFSTPVGIQYRLLAQSYLEAGACNGIGGGHEGYGGRSYYHVATDWNHPFVVYTDTAASESWRSDQYGCVGSLREQYGCNPIPWSLLNGTTEERLESYGSAGSGGTVDFAGVNERNYASVSGGFDRRSPDYLADTWASASASGETPIAFSYAANTPPPTSLGVHIRARSKNATTVNKPVPPASFIYLGGQLQPGVYEPLAGSPAGRTYKDPNSPATRTYVTAYSGIRSGVVGGQTRPTTITGGTDGPIAESPQCTQNGVLRDITACEREIRYYGAHASTLNAAGLGRYPIPAYLLGTGTKVIGEIVTYSVVPTVPAYDASLGEYGWAFQVAAKLGGVVRRQLIYAESYYGNPASPAYDPGYSCVPPTLTTGTTLAARRGQWTRLAAATVSVSPDVEVKVDFAAGQGSLITNAAVAGVTATGSGSGTVSLRGLRSAVQTALTQRIVWYRNPDPQAAGDTLAVTAYRTASPACLATRVIGVNITEQNLLNIDFGGTANLYGYSDKTGPAAVGMGGGDVWEAISYYYKSNLRWWDGASSGTAVSIDNSAQQNDTPVYGSGHPDAMLNDFIRRANNTPLAVSLSAVPVGTYDVYVYAHQVYSNGNSTVQLRRNQGTNSVVLGSAVTTPEAIAFTEPWSEGRQYVVFRDVAITNAATQSLRLVLSGPTGTGTGYLNGLQLLKKQ
jgi:hypothetical protein